MAENDLINTETTIHQSKESVDADVENLVYEFLRDSLRKRGYNFPLPEKRRNARRTIEADVGTALRQLADEFISQYREQFNEMCSQLTLTVDTVNVTIEGVANELFGEGIRWARIVAFFVFGSELAIHCIDRNAQELVNILADSISSYVTKTLLPWIKHHGGWSGLVQFMEEGRNVEGETGGRWPSVKNLICIGMTAVGAITIGAVLSRT